MLSKSSHLLRLSGTGSTEPDNVIQAEDCDYRSGIETENCSEGGLNAAFIENGDYIGFRDVDLTDAKDADFRLASTATRLTSSPSHLYAGLDSSIRGLNPAASS